MPHEFATRIENYCLHDCEESFSDLPELGQNSEASSLY
jgi:hypothetical protein